MAEPAQRVGDGAALGATQALGAAEEVALWKDKDYCGTGLADTGCSHQEAVRKCHRGGGRLGKGGQQEGWDPPLLQVDTPTETRATAPGEPARLNDKSQREGVGSSRHPWGLGCTLSCWVCPTRPESCSWPCWHPTC